MNILQKVMRRIQGEGNRGQIDILYPPATVTNSRVRKNNYTSYDLQVKAIDDKYNCTADYGSTLTRAVIDTRTAFICGSGLSFTAKNEATKEFIEIFLKHNELTGTNLINLVQGGEKEGKQLIILKPNRKEQVYETRQFSYNTNHYTVNTKDDDYTEIVNITYSDDLGNDYTISIDKSVYVKLGGSENNINITPPRIANVLTQIDNYERALYDLRENNHLFGFTTPHIKTQTQNDAKAIQQQLSASKWKIGDAFVGTADFAFVSPTTGASDTLKEEMSLNLKLISGNTGIPVHWLGWTDLMSNRAVAEELLEFVNVSTKKERLIWEMKMKELIIKAMILSVDAGFEGAVYDTDFEVFLPFVSLQQVKALSETWLPLQQSGVISMASFRNMIPNVDPEKEEDLMEQESNNDFNSMKSSNEVVDE
jgi:hypothetical protein